MFLTFIKENRNLCVGVLIVIVLIPAILLIPSDCGVIPREIGLQLVGYSGSLIGGFFTLYGVWWTIKDQHEKRIEELEIQYRPIPFLDAYNETDELGNRVFPIKETSDHKYNFIYTLVITNKGRGELTKGKITSCFMNCSDIDAEIKCSDNVSFINVQGSEKYSFVITNLINLNQEIRAYFEYEYSDLFAKSMKKTRLEVVIKLKNESEDFKSTIIDTYSYTYY